jgi:hypothetical protein
MPRSDGNDAAARLDDLAIVRLLLRDGTSEHHFRCAGRRLSDGCAYFFCK